MGLEGETLVKGIELVGDAINTWSEGKDVEAKKDKEDRYNLIVRVIGMDFKSEKLGLLAFITCINDCGTPLGRIADTVRSLSIAQNALEGRPEPPPKPCAKCVKA